MRRRVRRFVRCDVSVRVVLGGRDGARVQHVVHHTSKQRNDNRADRPGDRRSEASSDWKESSTTSGEEETRRAATTGQQSRAKWRVAFQ